MQQQLKKILGAIIYKPAMGRQLTNAELKLLREELRDPVQALLNSSFRNKNIIDSDGMKGVRAVIQAR